MEGVLTAVDPRLTGRLLASGRAGAPLLVCIHGGGCDGRYFDLRGFSVAEAALARGLDVLLVDRPGHGAGAPPQSVGPIGEAAALLADHLAAVLATRASSDLVVIGHSIGGAVALTLAADRRAPVRALAVSGIGRAPSDGARAWLDERAAVDPEPDPDFFFGPEGSFDWRGPTALRRAVQPWRRDEVEEVIGRWPARFDAVAGAIEVPVSFHLAEHERIWRAGPADVAAAAERFARSPRVASGLLPDGGHLYEIHKRGPEMVARQLDFLLSAVAVPAEPGG